MNHVNPPRRDDASELDLARPGDSFSQMSVDRHLMDRLLHAVERPALPADTRAVAAQGRHAGEWGLAAILISALTLVLFPIMVLAFFASMVGAYHNDFLQPSHLDLGMLAAWVSALSLLLLAIFALLCGVVGLSNGLLRKQPLGLSVGGIVIALVAVAVNILLFIIMLECVSWTRQFKRDRFSGHFNPPLQRFR